MNRKMTKDEKLIFALIGLLFVFVIGTFILISSLLEYTYIENNYVELSRPTISSAQISYSDMILQAQKQEKKLKEESLIKIIQLSKFRVSKDTARGIYEAAERASIIYNIDKNLILALASVESDFLPTANSYLGPEYGRGILQVSEIALLDYNNRTGNSYEPQDLYDYNICIDIGCWVYKQNIKYGVLNNTDDLVIAYNTGHGTYKRQKDYLLNGHYSNGRKYTYLDNVKATTKEFKEI
jgi:soluble lytic murein transglycosylase-like protein